MAPSNPETLSLECSERPDQVLYVGEVTLGEKVREIMQQKTEKQKQKQRILMAVVALLNSGGGVVRAAIKNENYKYDTDGLGLDLEEALQQLVNSSTIKDYFRFSQIGMNFFIFVKTWSSTEDQVRLCSIDTGLRIRSETQALNVANNGVTEFLMKQKTRNLAKGEGDEPVAKRRRSSSGDRPNVYEGKVTITPDDPEKKIWEKYPNLMPKKGTGVLILSSSWAVDIDRPKNKEVICEALLICEENYPKLFFMVKKESSDLWEYAKDTAFQLRQKLVNVGGYSEWVCVIPQLVNCETGQLIPRHQGSPDTVIEPQYPDCYKPEKMKVVRALLRALVIVVMSFTSALSNQLGQEYLNLLTSEQFKILQSKYDVQDMRQMFVHGYPGTGKTVLATQAIRKIKNTFGCETSNILYICENAPLKEFIRRENICQSVTRSCFVKEEFPDIKHIIVDEAQNFRLEDGDWYKKAKQIVKPGNGVLWVFLDYFQLSHTKSDGLPSPSKQTSKCILDQSLRNSVAVYNEVSKKLDRIRVSKAKRKRDVKEHMERMFTQKNCMHSLPGYYKEIITTKKGKLSRLTSLLRNLLSQGNSPKDIAILGSTLDRTNRVKQEINSLTQEMNFSLGSAENLDKNVVVVDSIRRFSGLERNIVILINPVVHMYDRKIKEHFLVSGFSRARIQLYVIFVKERIGNKSVKGTTD